MNGKALFGLCVVWRYENCEICLASTSSFSLVTENGKYPGRAGVTWSNFASKKSGWCLMRNLVLNNNASTVRGIFSCALKKILPFLHFGLLLLAFSRKKGNIFLASYFKS